MKTRAAVLAAALALTAVGARAGDPGPQPPGAGGAAAGAQCHADLIRAIRVLSENPELAPNAQGQIAFQGRYGRIVLIQFGTLQSGQSGVVVVSGNNNNGQIVPIYPGDGPHVFDACTQATGALRVIERLLGGINGIDA